MSKLVERIKAAVQEVELGHAEYRPEYRDVVALLAHIERLETEARRYQILRELLHNAKAGGSLYVNSDLQVYEQPEPGKEVVLIWYPSTPVGCYEVTGATLDAVVDEAATLVGAP